MNLQTELAPQHKSGLLLKNPVMMASGTFGYGVEYARLAEIHRLGAIVCKGTTLRPRAGNEQPRTHETPSGMLNAIGLQNPGVRAVLRKYAPQWANWQMPVIVNIAGDTVEEFVEVARIIEKKASASSAGGSEGQSGIAGIEINVSCPNILAGGAVFGADAQSVAEVTAAVRHATTLPIIVKLSPNSGDARPTALAAASSGADAISLINTITGLAIDPRARRPVLANLTGGLSGPAIKPIALRMVYEVASELRVAYPSVPIIGIGGICNTNDALEFLMAGASAIQLGTINFINPHAGVEIIEGIATFLQREGILSLADIIGCALP